MKLYEILLRFDEKGDFQGAHVIEWQPNGMPGPARPIKPEDWPDIAKAVNAKSVTAANQLRIDNEQKDKDHEKAMQEHEQVIAAKDFEIQNLKSAVPSISEGTGNTGA